MEDNWNRATYLKTVCKGLRWFYAYASVEGVSEMAGWKHHAGKEETPQNIRYVYRGDKYLQSS